jgi:hypothetical protein
VLKQPFLHEREFGDDSFNAFLANPIFRFSLGQGDLISPIDFSHYPFIAAARRCPSTIIAQDRSIHPLWYRNQGITHHIKAVALGLTDAQRSAIYAINSDAPVVAITGAPGTGKTALPAVAASLRPYTPRPQSPARLIPSPPPNQLTPNPLQPPLRPPSSPREQILVEAPNLSLTPSQTTTTTTTTTTPVRGQHEPSSLLRRLSRRPRP